MPYSNAGSDMLTYEKNPEGLIMKATIPNGTPATTASLFAPGALVTSLDDSKIYRNSGTSAAPVWENISLITASEIDPAVIQVISVSLTAAQLIAMYAAPISVIPAVAGKEIYLQSVEFDITRTSTAFTGGGVVNLQYDSTANGAGTTLHADIAATVVTGSAGATHTVRIPKDLSDIAAAGIVGKGVYISNKSAAFAAGTGTATVIVRYWVQ